MSASSVERGGAVRAGGAANGAASGEREVGGAVEERPPQLPPRAGEGFALPHPPAPSLKRGEGECAVGPDDRAERMTRRAVRFPPRTLRRSRNKPPLGPPAKRGGGGLAAFEAAAG